MHSFSPPRNLQAEAIANPANFPKAPKAFTGQTYSMVFARSCLPMNLMLLILMGLWMHSEHVCMMGRVLFRVALGFHWTSMVLMSVFLEF